MTITDRRSGSASASSATSRLGGIPDGLAFKAPVYLATTANITLSGVQTIDGVSATAGKRVLVKDQTTASENGIYDVSSGAWTRSVDFATNGDVVCGTWVQVTSGTVSARCGFVVTTADPITIGTTSIAFGPPSLQFAFDKMALGGATIGSYKLAVLGTTALQGNVTIGLAATTTLLNTRFNTYSDRAPFAISVGAPAFTGVYDDTLHLGYNVGGNASGGRVIPGEGSFALAFESHFYNASSGDTGMELNLNVVATDGTTLRPIGIYMQKADLSKVNTTFRIGDSNIDGGGNQHCYFNIRTLSDASILDLWADGSFKLPNSGFATQNGIMYADSVGKFYQNSKITVNSSGDISFLRTSPGAAVTFSDVARFIVPAGGVEFSFDAGSTFPTIIASTYTEMTEVTAPSAPAANKVRIYADDNGAGKTRVMALFASGAAQVMAIQP